MSRSRFTRRAAQTVSALTGLIRKVHVAKRQLALADEDYRAILLRATGKASSSSCTIAELERVLREFARLGWRARKTPPARAGKRPMADSEVALKLRALWISGYELGVVADPREESLVAFCKRVSGGRKNGVDALQWLTERDARKCIEGLKSWIAREADVDWSLSGNPRMCVVIAQWQMLRPQLGGATLPLLEQEAFRVTGKARLEYLGDREWDALVRHLGEKVRAMKAEIARPS
jgi:phage gp16-like protein